MADNPAYYGIVKYVSSGPVVAMVWEGLNAVKIGRVLLGAPYPANSAPGTIRGDACIEVGPLPGIGRIVIHGSDAVEAANREINLWFTEEELINWGQAYED